MRRRIVIALLLLGIAAGSCTGLRSSARSQPPCGEDQAPGSCQSGPQSSARPPEPNQYCSEEEAQAACRDGAFFASARCCTEAECERACNEEGGGMACAKLAKIRERLRQPNPLRSLEPLRRACEQGIPEACDRVGELRRACDGGFFPGCRHLGGTLSDEQLERVTHPLRLACKKGSASDCLRLGGLLLGKRSLQDAESALRRGCDLGSGQACYVMADSVSRGSSEVRSRDYRRSCELGFLDGCVRTGSELGQSETPAEGLAPELRVCESSHGNSDSSCRSWAALLERLGRSGEAAARFGPGCDGGRAADCHRHGLVLDQLNRDQQALGAFERACQAGRPKDCHLYHEVARRLGRPLPTLEPVRRACCACCGQACTDWGHALGHTDRARAAWAYGRGCDAGDAHACSELGFVLRETGHLEEAAQAYERSCRVDESACFDLVGVLEQLGRHEEAKRILERIPGIGYE